MAAEPCPSCGAPRTPGAPACAACGVDFEKWQRLQQAKAEKAGAAAASAARRPVSDGALLKILAGMAVAMGSYAGHGVWKKKRAEAAERVRIEAERRELEEKTAACAIAPEVSVKLDARERGELWAKGVVRNPMARRLATLSVRVALEVSYNWKEELELELGPVEPGAEKPIDLPTGKVFAFLDPQRPVFSAPPPVNYRVVGKPRYSCEAS